MTANCQQYNFRTFDKRGRLLLKRSCINRNMIYIVTAIYAEAHPLIIRFQLKKEPSHTRFQVFLNEEASICLIISGTGMIPAAAAVSSICTEYGAGGRNLAEHLQGDFLLNVGVCGQIRGCGQSQSGGQAWQTDMIPEKEAHSSESVCRIGQVLLCNKIRELATGRTFYPDILYRHCFEEAPILTGPVPYHKTSQIETGEGDFCLYDMEASAIYQAGAYYFGPHQMGFLKVISDEGQPGNVTPQQVEHLIAHNVETLSDYIESLQLIARREYQDDPLFQGRSGEVLERLCLDLHCSSTMSRSLRQHIRYCILAGVDYGSVLDEMYREEKLPCRDKREGKQCFEELKKRLL